MLRVMKRVIPVVILMLFPIGMLFAGGSSEPGAAASSPPVKITGYLLGDAPAGMPEVLKQLNEKLTKDINATMELNYIGWGDMQAKYPLVLAAGEDIDWIFTANWAFYFQEAAKGAFLNLTEDMLQKDMPLMWKRLPKAAWDQVRLQQDNNIYMIPTPTPDKKVPVVAIRGDLRKKYGLAPITRFSDIEPYLAAIKKNEPNMIPMNLDSQYDIGAPFGALLDESGPHVEDILFTTGSGTGIDWTLGDSSHKLTYLMDQPLIARQKAAAVTMKKWYDAGYLNKDVFANKVRSKDSFAQGKSAVGFGNAIDIQGTIASATANGWEVELIPVLDSNGHYKADPYLNNGVALSAGTKNADVTLKALDRMIEDKAYNYLVYFGVEGVNYVVKDGKIDLPAGLTADKNTYPPDAAGFWFTDKDQFLPLANWTPNYLTLRNNIIDKGYLVNSPFAAFSANVDEVKAEVANVNQTMVQYLQPIWIGVTNNVDASFATLDQKLKAAGVQKIQSVFQKQVDEYMKRFQ